MSKKVSFVDVLIKAKELIQVPGALINGKVFPHDGGGIHMHKSVKEANQYCAYGAVYKAQYLLTGTCPESHYGWAFGRSPESTILDKAAGGNAANYSNTHVAAGDGVEAVSKMFCKAIELALEQEPCSKT